MKNKIKNTSILFLFSVLNLSFLNAQEIPNSGNYDVYQQLLDKNSNKKFSCPGLKISKTCGNFFCDIDKGENAANCPADCSTHLLASHNKQTLCEGVQQVVVPNSAEEVAKFVASAVALNLPIKAVGSRHTANSLICTKGMLIQTTNLNKIYGIEKNPRDTLPDGTIEETVTVDAGVKLHELTTYLDSYDRSIGVAMPGFRTGTIAGLVATGVHGSSAKNPAVISYSVRGLEMVNAEGQIVQYDKNTTPVNTWKALVTNLGILGIVTKVRLAIQPQFNLEVEVTPGKDTDLVNVKKVRSLISDCDYGILHWFPNSKKYFHICGTKTEEDAEEGAENTLLAPKFPSFVMPIYKQALQLSSCSNSVSRVMEKVRYYTLKLTPPLVKEVKGKLKGKKDVIGKSHMMITSELTPYEQTLFQRDWEAVLPLEDGVRALGWLKDFIKQKKFGLPLFGVFLRFAPIEDKSLLTHATAGGAFVEGQVAMYIELPTYYPVDISPEMRQNYDDFFYTVLNTLVKNYNARPHWAKNEDWSLATEEVMTSYGEKWDQFKEVRKSLDPNGVFLNQFSEIFKEKEE